MFIRLLILSLWFIKAAAQETSPPPPPPPPPPRAAVDPTLHVDMMANQYMNFHQIPGLAIALSYQDQGTIFTYGLANRTHRVPVTGNSIFELGAITKLFTAIDLVLQVERNRMDLQDPVTFYLAGIDRFRGAINFITLQQLATNTSGLPYAPPPLPYYFPYTRGQVISYVQHWIPPFAPGAAYRESNLGYGLLGYALERVTSNYYETVIKKDILQPLGMVSTGVNLSSHLLNNLAQGYTYAGRPVGKRERTTWPAAEELRSSIDDMLKFLEANLGIGVNPPLLYAMQMAQQGYFTVDAVLSLGLGWQRVISGPVLIIERSGELSGYSSYIGLVPSLQIGVVLLANKSEIGLTQFGRNLLMTIQPVPDLHIRNE